MNKIEKLVFIFLLFVTIFIWIVNLSMSDSLKIITCEVGQGDAHLIIYGTFEVLVDGGPNRQVIDCLSKFLPFWDRRIEVVILTHNHKDHWYGLLETVRRYDVQVLITNKIDFGNQELKVLGELVGSKNVKVLNDSNSAGFNYGPINFLLLHDYFFELSSEKDLNEHSIVLKLSYKKFDALFTGDATVEQLKRISIKYDLMSDLYKVGHHGSNTSTNDEILKLINPKIAFIPVGKNNYYKHPHREVIELLNERKVITKRTDLEGNLILITDGEKITLK